MKFVKLFKKVWTFQDVITPKEIKLEYTSLFENKRIALYSYNIETVLAEKIESIISRGIDNTRMRDYYDIYILYKLKENEIDFKRLMML